MEVGRGGYGATILYYSSIVDLPTITRVDTREFLTQIDPFLGNASAWCSNSRTRQEYLKTTTRFSITISSATQKLQEQIGNLLLGSVIRNGTGILWKQLLMQLTFFGQVCSGRHGNQWLMR